MPVSRFCVLVAALAASAASACRRAPPSEGGGDAGAAVDGGAAGIAATTAASSSAPDASISGTATDAAPQDLASGGESGVDSGLEDTRDPFASAVEALELAAEAGPRDSGGPGGLGFDVTVRSAKVTPKGALADPLPLLQQERWRFRACARGFPADAGPLPDTLVIRIGEGGEPLKAYAPAGSPQAVGDCLARAGRAVAFPEPDGGIATVELTFTWLTVPTGLAPKRP